MLVQQIDQAHGDGGTRTTLAVMAHLIRSGSVSPVVREAAIGLTRGVPSRDGREQAAVIRWFVATHVTFMPDPDGVELVHGADVLVRAIRRDGVVAADCDDVAVLAGALAKSIGMPVRLVAVALDGRQAFGHVWAEARDRGGVWHDFDVTRSAQGLDGQRVNRTLIVRV